MKITVYDKFQGKKKKHFPELARFHKSRTSTQIPVIKGNEHNTRGSLKIHPQFSMRGKKSD